MKTTRFLAAARWGVLAASLAATQCAQAQPEAPPPPHRPPRFEGFMRAGPALEHDRVVAGAPYCADAEHETVQTLADGNRIVQRQASRQCRDAQGRTRQEVASGQQRNVYLRDPVAQETWLLDPGRKRATRLGLHGGPPFEIGEPPAGWEQRLAEWSREMRHWGREMKDWGRGMRDRLRPSPPATPQPPQPPAPPAPDIALDLPPIAVRIVVDGVELAGLPWPPPPGALPPAVAFHARGRAPRGAGVVTVLPAETIEGVRAQGRRTTWTLEAGRIGNEKTLVTVREVWTSPDLMITLRSRDADPLAGEDTYRVRNLVRGEPDPALFRIPADYRKVVPPALPVPRPPGP